MKYWVATIVLVLFSASAHAEVSGSAQSLIEKKHYEAAKAKQLSAGKIEYLRNNKGNTAIMSTGTNYNLEDLAPASGNKTSEKAETKTENKKLEDNKFTGTPKAKTANTGSLNGAISNHVEAIETPEGL